MAKVINVRDENRQRNQFRREAISMGIGSPARQHRYATARLRGLEKSAAKLEALRKDATLGY